MKKSKIVMYECTSSLCRLVVPEDHEHIQKQKKEHPGIFYCPECSSPMCRRVFKEKKGE